MASTATRPNCSSQPGVGSDGTARTSRPAVERRQLRLVRSDPTKLRRAPTMPSAVSTVAQRGPRPGRRRRSRSAARSRPATASRSTSTPLWAASRPTYPTTRGPRGPEIGRGRERVEVDPQRDQGGRAGEAPCARRCAPASALHTLIAGGVAQGPPLQPAERRRVALVDVLGGVEDVRRALPAQPPQQQDLGGRQREGLLVDVDDVVGPAERAPQRERVRRRTAPGGGPRCAARARALPDRGTNGTTAPPSSHRRAVSRSTSAPRARRCRSRSRQASTTALWKTRRTRISSLPASTGPPRLSFDG